MGNHMNTARVSPVFRDHVIAGMGGVNVDGVGPIDQRLAGLEKAVKVDHLVRAGVLNGPDQPTALRASIHQTAPIGVSSGGRNVRYPSRLSGAGGALLSYGQADRRTGACGSLDDAQRVSPSTCPFPAPISPLAAENQLLRIQGKAL